MIEFARQNAINACQRIIESRSIGGHVSRFAIVGILATTIYFVLANALILTGLVIPSAASVLAYCVGMIVSFLGQSSFTFRLMRRTWAHAVRFIVISAIGLAISYASVVIVEYELGLHPSWGTVAAAFLVPIMSFVAFKLWVFVPADPGSRMPS